MQPLSDTYSITGEGPAVVLIHGVGSSRRAWSGIIPRLANSYRCISYDLRGHGKAPKPARPFTMDDLVEDLESLLVELGVDSAHLIGHSLGGMIAPSYARKHPHRVRSLSLLSTIAGRSEEDNARSKAILSALETGGLEAAFTLLVGRWFTDTFIARHEMEMEERRRLFLTMDPAIYANTYRIFAETEMAPWLHKLSMPALVLTGALDPGCHPAGNRLIAESMPLARLVILEDLKHSLLTEAPGIVAGEIKAFLDQVI